MTLSKDSENPEKTACKEQGWKPTLNTCNIRSFSQHCIKNWHHSIMDITTKPWEHFGKPLSVKTLQYKAKATNQQHPVNIVSVYQDGLSQSVLFTFYKMSQFFWNWVCIYKFPWRSQQDCILLIIQKIYSLQHSQFTFPKFMWILLNKLRRDLVAVK